TETPVLDAYGDMADYALDEIRYAGHLGAPTEGILARYVEFFDEVYRAVFNPVGMVDDYADRMREFERMGPELSAEIKAEL
ncbi:MAG: hypothetical protein JSU65_08835, partial [Candidatus Zixiibacteriota bacterium]